MADQNTTKASLDEAMLQVRGALLEKALNEYDRAEARSQTMTGSSLQAAAERMAREANIELGKRAREAAQVQTTPQPPAAPSDPTLSYNAQDVQRHLAQMQRVNQDFPPRTLECIGCNTRKMETQLPEKQIDVNKAMDLGVDIGRLHKHGERDYMLCRIDQDHNGTRPFTHEQLKRLGASVDRESIQNRVATPADLQKEAKKLIEDLNATYTAKNGKVWPDKWKNGPAAERFADIYYGKPTSEQVEAFRNRPGKVDLVAENGQKVKVSPSILTDDEVAAKIREEQVKKILQNRGSLSEVHAGKVIANERGFDNFKDLVEKVQGDHAKLQNMLTHSKEGLERDAEITKLIGGLREYNGQHNGQLAQEIERGKDDLADFFESQKVLNPERDYLPTAKEWADHAGRIDAPNVAIDSSEHTAALAEHAARERAELEKYRFAHNLTRGVEDKWLRERLQNDIVEAFNKNAGRGGENLPAGVDMPVKGAPGEKVRVETNPFGAVEPRPASLNIATRIAEHEAGVQHMSAAQRAIHGDSYDGRRADEWAKQHGITLPPADIERETIAFQRDRNAMEYEGDRTPFERRQLDEEHAKRFNDPAERYKMVDEAIKEYQATPEKHLVREGPEPAPKSDLDPVVRIQDGVAHVGADYSRAVNELVAMDSQVAQRADLSEEIRKIGDRATTAERVLNDVDTAQKRFDAAVDRFVDKGFENPAAVRAVLDKAEKVSPERREEMVKAMVESPEKWTKVSGLKQDGEAQKAGERLKEAYENLDRTVQKGVKDLRLDKVDGVPQNAAFVRHGAQTAKEVASTHLPTAKAQLSEMPDQKALAKKWDSLTPEGQAATRTQFPKVAENASRAAESLNKGREVPTEKSSKGYGTKVERKKSGGGMEL